MGSTQRPDRSLASGIPIPQWMKTKMNDRFDLEDTAFSPPNQDDSFFYMRYPRHHVETEKVKTTERIVDTDQEKVINCNTDNKQASKMTDVVINKENSHLTKTAKSLAGDDLFRGEHAGYGHSIVQVAHQMISGGLVGRPTLLGHKSSEEKRETQPPPPPQRTRRGSKSLPASPLSTPDSTPQIHRKNRYFTNPFVETDSDRYSKYPGSWLFAGVLSTQREAVGSRDALDGSQLDLADPDHASVVNVRNKTDSLRRNKSSSAVRTEQQENRNLGLSSIESERPKKSSPPNGLARRPKPSELRELNFWSPTSM